MFCLLRDEEGFSLVEVMVALSILLIVTLAIMAIVVTGIKANARTEDFMIATKAVEAAMERIMAVPFEHTVLQFPAGYEEPIELLEAQQGWWTVTYPKEATEDPDLLNIKVAVYWQGRDGFKHTIELNTLKS